jgi:hypothetical protein
LLPGRLQLQWRDTGMQQQRQARITAASAMQQLCPEHLPVATVGECRHEQRNAGGAQECCRPRAIDTPLAIT